MERIKDTLQAVLKALQKKSLRQTKDSPEKLIPKVFSKREQKHIKFHNYRKDTLTINVDSSTWLYYLSLRKEELLSKLREFLPQLKEIHFWISTVGDEKEKSERR